MDDWGMEEVAQHFKKLHALDAELSKLRKQRIEGRHLKDLTRKELCTEPLGLALGLRLDHEQWRKTGDYPDK
jgi:hypothetical protein